MQGETGPARMQQPAPLTRAELEPLWRRERQVSWLQIAAMAGLLLAGVLAQRVGTLAWAAGPLLAGVLVLLVAASVLQVRTRCPRCRTWLRGKLLRILPDRCRGCGVEFPREPSGGG
jgi:hypothetical protein